MVRRLPPPGLRTQGVAILVLVLSHVTQCEVFTALVHMKKVLEGERDMARDIKAYVQSEQERLDTLRRIAEDYDTHSREALVDTEKHLSNPVNAFLLVKRFTTDWDKVKDLIETNKAEEHSTSPLSSKSWSRDHEFRFLQPLQPSLKDWVLSKTSSLTTSDDIAVQATDDQLQQHHSDNECQ